MANKYDELTKRINVLKGQIAQKTDALQQAEDYVKGSNDEFNALWKSFKQKVLSGEEVEINRVQNHIDELTANTRRNKALAEALVPKIAEMQDELEELINEKTLIFTDQARKWLKAEINAYDDLAGRLLNSVKRLFICYGLLKDVGEGQTGIDLIGDAFSYLSSLQLPTIKGFNRNIYAGDGFNRRQVNNPHLTEIQDVLKEIINK